MNYNLCGNNYVTSMKNLTLSFHEIVRLEKSVLDKVQKSIDLKFIYAVWKVVGL